MQIHIIITDKNNEKKRKKKKKNNNKLLYIFPPPPSLAALNSPQTHVSVSATHITTGPVGPIWTFISSNSLGRFSSGSSISVNPASKKNTHTSEMINKNFVCTDIPHCAVNLSFFRGSLINV